MTALGASQLFSRHGKDGHSTWHGSGLRCWRDVAAARCSRIPERRQRFPAPQGWLIPVIPVWLEPREGGCPGCSASAENPLSSFLVGLPLQPPLSPGPWCCGGDPARAPRARLCPPGRQGRLCREGKSRPALVFLRGKGEGWNLQPQKLQGTVSGSPSVPAVWEFCGIGEVAAQREGVGRGWGEGKPGGTGMGNQAGGLEGRSSPVETGAP